MLMPINVKYTAIPLRRPSRSATIGSITQPMIVPIDSSPVPYEASRAASGPDTPWRTAICVTAAGT